MSALHDMSVAFRRWRQVQAKGKSAPAMDSHAFRDAFHPLVDAAAGQVAEAHFIELPGDRPPWTATPIALAPGEEVTLFAVGRTLLSGALDLWFGPQFQLWARVGEAGPVFNGTRATNSFTADKAGRLYLGSQFPGQFSDQAGRLIPPIDGFEGTKGGLTVLAVRWNGPAREGVQAMLAAGDVTENGDALVAGELARLDAPPKAPDGWEQLWFLGRSDIYKEAHADHGPCIHCHTHGNVGILQKEAPWTLTPDTHIEWDWKVDVLPSALPEDTLPSHDYLSIAVEFENGRDLTYYWSRELAPGTGYWCPLPGWGDREFHVVVRSGEKDLGKWLSERRNVYEDYWAYIGAPPGAIIRVWLISVSLFQRGEGIVDYRNIKLTGGGEEKRIL